MPPPDRIMLYDDFRDDVRPDIEMSHLTYPQWLSFWCHQFFAEPLPADPGDGNRGIAKAFVESGRWMWDCGCGSGIVAPGVGPSICPYCLGSGWVDVIFPANRREIEIILLQMPGRRGRAALRDWHHDWPLARLEDRLRRARAKQAQGDLNPISLSIAPTVAYVVGQTLSATTLRNHVNRPIRDTAGRFGPIELEDTLQLANATDYALLYVNANGEMTMLDPASAGDLLVSSGPDAAPEFVSPSDLSVLEFVDADWQTNGTVTYEFDSAPVFVRAALVCTAAINGYEIGDVVQVTLDDENTVLVYGINTDGFSYRVGTTSITIRQADDTSTTFAATSSNFGIRFYLFL